MSLSPPCDAKPDTPLFDCLGELHMFSSLGPNNWVHRDRNGHFIPTGGTCSCIPGVQKAATVLKGHDPQVFAGHFSEFAKKLNTIVNDIFEEGVAALDPEVKKRKFNELHMAGFALEYALEGQQEGGGMQGLLETYQSAPILAQLKEAIDSLKECVFNKANSSKEWYPEKFSNCQSLEATDTLPYCPEEFFNDIEWETLMETCAKLNPESPSLSKYYLYYTLSLGCNQTMSLAGNWNFWDTIFEVGTTKIVLGALPLTIGAMGYVMRNDMEKLKTEGIEAVLSVVEVFENTSPGFIASPITPAEWKDNNIKQLQLPTPDFQTISLELIQRGVEFLRWNLINNRSVCIHCKAGRGRSALILMCYLIKYHGFTAEEAFNLVRKNRNQAGFKQNDPKYITLLDFERRCKAGKQAKPPREV